MSKTIAILGGGFDPAGIHHRAIAEILAMNFDGVVVIPSGRRPDKEFAAEPRQRVAMSMMTFCGLSRVSIDLSDIYLPKFTPNYLLEKKFSKQGEVWHVVGVDWLKNIDEWENGRRLKRQGRFAVITRYGYSYNLNDLPPHHRIFNLDLPGSSSEIRERVAKGLTITSLVVPEVEKYILKYGLYK